MAFGKQGAGTGGMGAVLGRAGTRTLGSLYAKTSWADLSDFTQVGSSASVVSNAIRFAYGGAVTFNQYLMLNSPITADENVDFTATFKCIALGTNFGISIGRKSVRANGDSSISAHLGSLSVNPNTLNFWPQASGAITSQISTSNVSGAVLAVNDIFTLKYSQRGNVCTMTYLNLTSGASGSLVVTSNMNAAASNFILPAVDKFCINIIGGTYDMTSMSIVSNQQLRPYLLCLGDSKTAGYSAASLAARWGTLIGPSFPSVEVFGGAGDPTASVLAEVAYIISLNPKNVLLNIGRNDLFYAIASGTWQANYASIVSQLQTAGINVVHLMPIPETTQDQSTLTTYINSTYPTGRKIDVTAGWVSGTMLSSDSTHPNAAGDTFIANTVIANASKFVGAATPASALDASHKGTVTLSNGNLTATGTQNSTWQNAFGTLYKSSGKYYCEMTVGAALATDMIGLANATASVGGVSGYPGNDLNSISYVDDGRVLINQVNLGSIATWTTGNVLGMAVDLDNGKIWFRVDGGNWNNSGAANPTSNSGGISISTLAAGPYTAAVCADAIGSAFTINFGGSSYAQTAPAGFSSWG